MDGENSQSDENQNTTSENAESSSTCAMGENDIGSSEDVGLTPTPKKRKIASQNNDGSSSKNHQENCSRHMISDATIQQLKDKFQLEKNNGKHNGYRFLNQFMTSKPTGKRNNMRYHLPTTAAKDTDPADHVDVCQKHFIDVFGFKSDWYLRKCRDGKLAYLYSTLDKLTLHYEPEC